MHNSKLLQYLSRFSNKEMKIFQDFVHSPYFNKHQKTKELIDYIIAAKQLSSPELQLENVFQKIFPGQKYQEQLLRTIMSYLIKLIYKYYAQAATQNSDHSQSIPLLEKALHDGQEKMFKQQSDRWEKSKANSKNKDANSLLEASKFYRLQDNFDIHYGKRSTGIFLEKSLTTFDSYYLSEKLRLTCEMLARKQVTGQNYDFPLLNEIIAYLENEGKHFENISEVWIYYLIFKMIHSDDDNFYFQLKKRLKVDAPFFSSQESRDLYTHALNFCISKLNFGNTSFKKETFELYQQMLEFGLLHRDNILPQWDYTNIVKLGCDLQESEWTKKFIFDQKEYLSVADRENTFTYNLAAYHLAQKEYDQSHELIQKVEFTESYYNLLTRILMLKIYFETKDWTTLEYYLDAFRLYILRNRKLGEQRRKSVMKFIKHTRNLAKLKERSSTFSKNEITKKLDELFFKIKNDENVLNSSWLISMLKH